MLAQALVITLSINFSVCRTDFIVTASCDGHIKFWKKQEEGIEFVKHFRAHLGMYVDEHKVILLKHYSLRHCVYRCIYNNSYLICVHTIVTCCA